MERVIPVDGGIYMDGYRSAKVIGVSHQTMSRWARNGTSYGLKLRTTVWRGYTLLCEKDVVVAAAVQRKFPLLKGPIPPERAKLMRDYARKLQATPALTA